MPEQRHRVQPLLAVKALRQASALVQRGRVLDGRERAFAGSLESRAQRRVAETYQGDYGLIPDISGEYVEYSDPLKLLGDLGDWIAENRHEIGDEDDTYLQNEIDNIMTLIRQSSYKLRFLK